MHRIRINALFLLVTIALLAGVLGNTTRAQPEVPVEPLEPVRPAQSNLRYVPMTSNGVIPSTVFGVEMTAGRPDRGLDAVAQLGPAWVRRNALLWKDVELIEGRGYKWTVPNVAALEAELIAISARGLQPILIIGGYPRWAARTDCAPINPDKIGKFAAFVAEAVKRYSQPPYNVRVWELGNEPDATYIGADNNYGCWGIASDPFYGGRAYGNMLKQVYPAIKAANSQVQVMNGGLLLERADVPMAKFMEGVFLAGAANSFDILAFHSYCMFDPKNQDGHDAYFKSCANDWKVPLLRNLAAKYGVPNKPFFRTEAGLLCSIPNAACRQHQADFVARHYARTARDGVLGSIWYQFDSDSFFNTALVEPGNPGVPRPSYAAMKNAAAMFGGAQYAGPLTGQPSGVEGYRFRRIGQSVTVLWSNTPQTANVPVAPGVPVICTGRDGQQFSCANNGGNVVLPVGPSPTFVVTP